MKMMNLDNLIKTLQKEDDDYPKKLLDLNDAPEKLYVIRKHRAIE